MSQHDWFTRDSDQRILSRILLLPRLWEKILEDLNLVERMILISNLKLFYDRKETIRKNKLNIMNV